MPEYVYGKTVSIEVTPTITTSSAYTIEDQIGGVQTLSQTLTDPFGLPATVTACGQKNKSATLQTVVVTDKAKQRASLTIYVFDESPTVAGDKTAYGLTDAELADKCKGSAKIYAGDYDDVSSATVATGRLDGATSFMSKATNGELYVVAKMSSSNCQYTSTTDLTFTYVLAQDR